MNYLREESREENIRTSIDKEKYRVYNIYKEFAERLTEGLI